MSEAQTIGRLRAVIRLDIRLQFSNGFYYAAAVVVLMLAALLAWLPEDSTSWLLPIVILTNILINGFYFIAGLVLLEKAEGSIEAQVVTPLRSAEYLVSKSLTLCALSVIESLMIVLLAGRGFEPLALVAGVFLATAMLSQFGFMLVARYDSINRFLFPSFLWTTLLMLPLLSYLNLAADWLLYLHPVRAPLVVLQAAFGPVSAADLSYGLLYGVLWTGVAFFASLRRFHRFVTTTARP